MIPAWAGAYVGLSWREKGRDRDGVDCWGLVRLVMAEQFGVDLPSFADDYVDPSERDVVSALLAGNIPDLGWRPVAEPYRAGDGAVFRLLNAPWHVGVLVNDRQFLHIEPEARAIVDRLDAYRWARRLYGTFRHVGAAEGAR